MTAAPETTPPTFLADAMLARLARWLRVLGYDTAFDPDLPDPALVERAAAEDRVLLTRDRHLVTHLRPARFLLITLDEPLEQLKQVVTACMLEVSRPLFTRCLVCNAQLREAMATEQETLVPASAREMGGPSCAVTGAAAPTGRDRTCAACAPHWSGPFQGRNSDSPLRPQAPEASDNRSKW